MRLWHKDLIEVLPRQQLLGQWRECCAIARNIAEKGTPNHMLINKVMDYPLVHLLYYGRLVACEIACRGYVVHGDKFDDWFRDDSGAIPFLPYPQYDELFKEWHNNRYLLQCYHNLEEKFDCGGISREEWKAIVVKVYSLLIEEVKKDGNNELQG